MIKSRGIGSIGGAMDLVTGAKEVIVTMEHITKENKLKILKNCEFQLTGINCVNKIITDIAVINITKQGLFISEIISLPFAIFFIITDTFTITGILLSILSGFVHVFYFYFLGTAYKKADLSFVYPIARGMALI